MLVYNKILPFFNICFQDVTDEIYLSLNIISFVFSDLFIFLEIYHGVYLQYIEDDRFSNIILGIYLLNLYIILHFFPTSSPENQTAETLVRVSL